MEQTKVLILAVVLATLLVLAGCRMVEPEPTPEPEEQLAMAEQRIGLIGTSWEVESFGGNGDTLPVLPDTKLTLNMVVERYAGYNGCNWFLGVYDVDGEGIRFNTPAMTAFICQDEAVSSQAATYSSSLVNITRYEMEGDKLVTYTVGDQKMATFFPAEPVAIEGTKWTAKFVNDGERMTPASSYEFTVSAVFENGKVKGNGGCNDYEADYVVDGDTITISNITSAGAECTDIPGANNVEAWYFAALEATTNYAALVTSLVFMDAEGNDQIFFGTP
jgi:heat shock protein HslJ